MTIRFRPFSWTICLLALVALPVIHAQQPATNAAPAPAASPKMDDTARALNEIAQLIQKGDNDHAMEKVNAAIKLYPKAAGFYALRGSINFNKKLYAQAEPDFQAASELDPGNMVIKLNYYEILFVQKKFDQARAGLVGMQKDDMWGDLADYKIFLCDLFGGHDDAAKKEFDAFNKVGSNASYYFANAAWDLFHKDPEGARGWLVSASRIYPPMKNEFYASSLRSLGYLPLPEPPKKTP